MADFLIGPSSTLADVYAPLKNDRNSLYIRLWLFDAPSNFPAMMTIQKIISTCGEICPNILTFLPKIHNLFVWFLTGRVHSDGTSWGFEPEFTDSMTNVTVATGRDAVLSCSVANLGGHKVKKTFNFKEMLWAFLYRSAYRLDGDEWVHHGYKYIGAG